MKTLCTILLFMLLWTSSAFSELIDRGGGLIYDTVIDVTYLQDADYPGTKGLFYHPALGYGATTWFSATNWVADFTYYDSVRDVYWDDWRLPSAYNLDGSGPDQGNVTTSEFGHMYLMWQAYPGMFRNVVRGLSVGSAYWTETLGNPGEAYYYSFDYGGWQEPNSKTALGYHIWAVRDGDVASVIPEPISSVLFFTGSSLFIGRRYFIRKHVVSRLRSSEQSIMRRHDTTHTTPLTNIVLCSDV